MNTYIPPDLIMAYNILREEHYGENPIMIDQSLLLDCDAKVKIHPCNWGDCNMHVALEHKHVSKHLQQRHGVNTSATSEETQKAPCLWLNCHHGQMKPGNMARHVLSTHLGVRWICLTCSRSYTREDAFRRHTQEKADCQFAKYGVSFGDGLREIYTQCINGNWSSSQNVICIP